MLGGQHHMLSMDIVLVGDRIPVTGDGFGQVLRFVGGPGDGYGAARRER